MLLKAIYWGLRIAGALWRRIGLRVSSRLHKAVLAGVGPGCQFQPGVRFADPSCVQIGAGCYFWRGVAVSAEQSGASLRVGDRVQINRDVHLDTTGDLRIGDRVLISEGAVIYTHDHGFDPRARPRPMPKVISDDVWIGMRAVILPQCRHIGRGAVIAAGAIVTRDVPAGGIVGGNPARLLGRANPHSQEVA